MTIDDRGRAEAGLLLAEARRVADTRGALDEVLAGMPSVPVHERDAGRHRPRRWLLVAAAAVVIGVAAAAIALVRRDPTDAPPVDTAPVTTPVTTAAPPTTVAPAPTSTLPATTAPQTTAPPTTSAPTAPVVAARPVSDFFVTVSGDRPSVIDVRDAAGLVASYDLGCPSDNECTVQSARVMDDTIWVAVTASAPGAPDAVVGSRVIGVNRSTGDIAVHLALDGPTAVWSAARGANGTLYAYLEAPTSGMGSDRTLVAVEDGGTRVLATGLSGFRVSEDGRFLAVSFAKPWLMEQPRFEITDLVGGTTATFHTDGINAGPAAWSPDGRHLIVDEQWEDGEAWVVDPWSGSGDPVAGTGQFLDGACFLSGDVIAHRTWNVGYGQGDAQLGVIRLTSLVDGSTAGELGADLFGIGLRCHPDGSITYLRRPVVEVESSPGYFQLEPDHDAPVELVHVAPDGTTTPMATGDLRMV